MTCVCPASHESIRRTDSRVFDHHTDRFASPTHPAILLLWADVFLLSPTFSDP
jgi:hypothetical protein